MQSVITGQAEITLERKIAPGEEKKIKADDNTITETNRIRIRMTQTKRIK